MLSSVDMSSTTVGFDSKDESHSLLTASVGFFSQVAYPTLDILIHKTYDCIEISMHALYQDHDTMSQRSHLTDSEAWRVVGRLEGNVTARRHRNINATLLQQQLCSATGTTVSTQTVRNRLHGVGLYARRPIVCVRLTSRHRRDRREWATEHVNWRRNERSNVLFSDKSRFSVHPDNRRIFIWRDRGSRNNPAFVHESIRFVGGGVLVYGGISIDGRTDLYIIRDGPLTARRYRDEILRPIVVPYAAAIGDDFILMDDNCRPHRANLVEDFLFEERIVQMEWPACSPDMNPIQHV
ncbi:transposable element Tcb1 transposase [Trichonephila clavipes]|nr:transposable element Tcb1 transposase [Trichonephila clavipes]